MINRRTFLSGCAASVGLHAQTSDSRIQLHSAYASSSVLAISPDGRYLCLQRVVDSRVNYSVPDEVKTDRTIAGPKAANYVIDIESASVKYTLPSAAFSAASFFEDSSKLYLWLNDLKNRAQEASHITLEMRTGKLTSRRGPSLPMNHAVGDGMLIAYNDRSPRGLLRVALPDYRVVDREPLDRGEDTSWDRVQGWEISGDRRFLIYTLDGRTIVCRRTGDFGIVWKKDGDLARFPAGVGMMALNHNGSYVAVAESKSREFSSATPDAGARITIYEVGSGKEVASIPLDGRGRMGLSPDGGVLAVGRTRIDTLRRETITFIDLYEIATMRKIGTIDHDHTRVPLLGGLVALGIPFTPDGKKLITSGVNTKIWDL